MKLTELQLLETESESLAKDYIRFLEDGETDAEFGVGSNQIRIWQDVDEDEPDKYYIIRDDVSSKTWDRLVWLIKKYEDSGRTIE